METNFFSDEFYFNLWYHDDCIRVQRYAGERCLLECIIVDESPELWSGPNACNFFLDLLIHRICLESCGTWVEFVTGRHIARPTASKDGL
ncbi:hypothetical protein TNCV_1763931 [Trichonephila clavipes]|nr:hypothetical protein TNCV_1763931 [Trichonephila clavipes]